MTDAFREICLGIIQGFRDAVLGTLHVFKLDAEKKESVKQPDVPLTTLAKRRAEKHKQGRKEKEKGKERYTKQLCVHIISHSSICNFREPFHACHNLWTEICEINKNFK